MNQPSGYNLKKAFTLIELIVVVAIIALVTLVVLANYKTFTNDSALTGSAYDLAISMRQVQLYGVSRPSTQDTGPQNAYGIHFDNTGSYIIYVDEDLLYQYDSSNASDLVSTNTLPQGFTFQKFCTVINGTQNCTNADNLHNSTSPYLDVEFIRPNPDMYLNTNLPIPPGTGQTLTPNSNVSTLYGTCIYMTNGSKVASVYVDKTGQISVNSTSCP